MTKASKVCGQCKEDKPLSEFYNVKSRPDGKHLYCKACCKLNNKVARVKKREGRQDYARKYYQKNKAEYQRRYKEQKARKAKARAEGRGERPPIAKTMGPKKATTRHTRRAKALGLEGDSTISLTELYKRDKGVCGICKKDVKPKEASIDHVIPMDDGGPHTWDNVQLAHLSCNCSKGAGQS